MCSKSYTIFLLLCFARFCPCQRRQDFRLHIARPKGILSHSFLIHPYRVRIQHAKV
jgi:hypothetical protein